MCVTVTCHRVKIKIAYLRFFLAWNVLISYLCIQKHQTIKTMTIEALKNILSPQTTVTIKLNGIKPEDISPYLIHHKRGEDEYSLHALLIAMGFYSYGEEEDLLPEDAEPAFFCGSRAKRVTLDYLRRKGLLNRKNMFVKDLKNIEVAYICAAMFKLWGGRSQWKKAEEWTKRSGLRESSNQPLKNPEIEKICDEIIHLNTEHFKVKPR